MSGTVSFLSYTIASTVLVCDAIFRNMRYAMSVLNQKTVSLDDPEFHLKESDRYRYIENALLTANTYGWSAAADDEGFSRDMDHVRGLAQEAFYLATYNTITFINTTHDPSWTRLLPKYESDLGPSGLNPALLDLEGIRVDTGANYADRESAFKVALISFYDDVTTNPARVRRDRVPAMTQYDI